MSQIEKLAAQKYIFLKLIYKYLTWAASENSSKCLFFFTFLDIWWYKGQLKLFFCVFLKPKSTPSCRTNYSLRLTKAISCHHLSSSLLLCSAEFSKYFTATTTLKNSSCHNKITNFLGINCFLSSWFFLFIELWVFKFRSWTLARNSL